MQSVYIEFKGTFYFQTLHTHGGWKKNWRHQFSDEPYVRVMQARLGVRVRVRVGQRSFRAKIFY